MVYERVFQQLLGCVSLGEALRISLGYGWSGGGFGQFRGSRNPYKKPSFYGVLAVSAGTDTRDLDDSNGTLSLPPSSATGGLFSETVTLITKMHAACRTGAGLWAPGTTRKPRRPELCPPRRHFNALRSVCRGRGRRRGRASEESALELGPE